MVASNDVEEIMHAKNAHKRPVEIGTRYILQKKIGQGSYGTVYSAIDKQSGEKVAVKVINDIFNTTTDARRTLREISILRQTDHLNLCKMIDLLMPVNIDNFTELYLVQNYGGWDLRKIMKNSELIEGWSEVHVKYIVYQMLCGLLYMKNLNIVHRDLKPSNLLMNDKCDLAIIDFGLAREIKQTDSDVSTDDKVDLKTAGVQKPQDMPRNSGSQQQLTQHVVTRWYRAPELILLQDYYNSAIDMWSVGCIFGELLMTVESGRTSKPLFPGTSCYPLSKDSGDYNPDTVRREFSNEQHQLNQIFRLIGTPTEEEVKKISNANFVEFLSKVDKCEARPLEARYKKADKSALTLLKQMLMFDPEKRINVEDALQSSYFDTVRNVESESKVDSDAMSFPWEDEPRLNRDAEKARLRKLILSEIEYFKNGVDQSEVKLLFQSGETKEEGQENGHLKNNKRRRSSGTEKRHDLEWKITSPSKKLHTSASTSSKSAMSCNIL